VSPSGDPCYDLLCIMSPLSHRKVMPRSIAFFVANRMPCGIVCHYPVLISSRQSKRLVACYCMCPLRFLGLMIVLSQFLLFLWFLKGIKFSSFQLLFLTTRTTWQVFSFRSRKIWGILLFSFWYSLDGVTGRTP
jgi:hypothetical protein